jgi:hypothetical protein
MKLLSVNQGRFMLLQGQNVNYLEPMSYGKMIDTEYNMQGKKRRINKKRKK